MSDDIIPGTPLAPIRDARQISHWHDFLAALLEMDEECMPAETATMVRSLHSAFGWATNCPGCGPQVQVMLENLMKVGKERGLVFDKVFPEMATPAGVQLVTFQITEEQRQGIILAVAVLSLLRPGWLDFLEDISRVFGGRSEGKEGRTMFDDFRKYNSPLALPKDLPTRILGDLGQTKTKTNENESNEAQPGTGSGGR